MFNDAVIARGSALKPRPCRVRTPQRGRLCGVIAAALLVSVSGPGMAEWRPATPLSPAGAAVGTPASSAAPAPDPLSYAPRAWVVEAAKNETAAIRHEGSYLRYRVHTTDHRGDRVRLTIESKDGTVSRLIQRDGRPITADEDKDERDRLSTLLNSPGDFAKHVKEDVEGKKLATDLIALLPDAMLYTYTPGQPQTQDAPGPEVVLDYAPNSGWNPPTTISEGLRGLRGRVWIDVQSHYVVRMEGDIFQSVNFGWGMLAHIYPGGKLLLVQRSLGPGSAQGGERWIYTMFSDDLKVRAVMLKTMSLHTTIESGDYHPLAGAVSYQDAIHMLLDTPVATQ